MARHRLMRAAKALAEKGVTPPGVDPEHQKIRSCSVVLPPDVAFKDGAKEALTPSPAWRRRRFSGQTSLVGGPDDRAGSCRRAEPDGHLERPLYLPGRQIHFFRCDADRDRRLADRHDPRAQYSRRESWRYALCDPCRFPSRFAVTFTKTYDRPDRYHQNPIVYEGALNSDGTEIEGRWTIIRVGPENF